MSTDPRRFRAGDAVSHEADVYTLACDEDDRGRVWPAGWPCSPLHAAECALVEAATDEARLAMLREAAQVSEREHYWPGCLARDQLSAEPPAWERGPVTHEWMYSNTPTGTSLNVINALTHGYTVAPWVHGLGCPATRPIQPSERKPTTHERSGTVDR